MSGKVKITIDVEVNEALMEMAKEAMANMPQLMDMMKKNKESE
jgi:hypothetical protein